MPHPRFSSEEIVRRGEDLYDQTIRAQVEKQHRGQMIVINVETGDYEIADSTLPAVPVNR